MHIYVYLITDLQMIWLLVGSKMLVGLYQISCRFFYNIIALWFPFSYFVNYQILEYTFQLFFAWLLEYDCYFSIRGGLTFSFKWMGIRWIFPIV